MAMEKKRLLPAGILAPMLLVLLLAPGGMGCGGGGVPLVLAATVDLEETGILQAWVEDVRSSLGREIELVVAPDQDIFDLCRHGECDLAVTHVQQEEDALARLKYVEEPREIMRDDYVVLGPAGDPAGVRGKAKASEGFKAIGDAGAPCVLRGDGSGNSYRAKSLLSSLEVETGSWLQTVDTGMGEALRKASREEAYTLSERSSYRVLAAGLDLEILLEGDADLSNPYRVMVVSSLTYPDTDTVGAHAVVDYLLSERARAHFKLGDWTPPREEGG